MTDTVAASSPRRSSLWRVDCLLLPLLTICYGLQFYDKAVLGSATIFGILEDLSLIQVSLVDGTKNLSRYSNASAAFYWGYLVAVVPAAFLAQRFRPNLFLGAAIFLWGFIVLLTPAISDWRGLVAQRFFLGVVESTVSPGFLLVTRQWYTKSELPARVGVWYSATGLFSILSGLINYSLGTSSNTAIATWKTLFIVPGVLTVFFGAVVTLLLPPSPGEDPLVKIPHYNVFSATEREAILAKTTSQMLGKGLHTTWSWPQVVEGLCDYTIWFYLAMAACIYVCNGGVTVFGPILIKSLGHSSTRAILLQTPGGATTVVSIFVVCLLSLRFKNARLPLLVLSCLPVVLGAALIWSSNFHTSHGAATALAGYYLLPIFGAPYVMLLSSLAANVAGSTKASFASGAVFVGYNVGNIASSYILKGSEAKHNYRSTWKIIIAMMIVTMALAIILAGLLLWENRRRDRDQSSVTDDSAAASAPAAAAAAAKNDGATAKEATETEHDAEKQQGDQEAEQRPDSHHDTCHAHEESTDGGHGLKDHVQDDVEEQKEQSKEGTTAGAESDLTDRQNKSFRYVL
ncbi:unnamed protein product [Parajaminaea phylloscopi]